jgi:hypothetical protein
MARERRDFNRISGIKDPALVVIATEGEKTEQQYFEGVKTKCIENASKIKLEILPPRLKGNSAPKQVLEQLNQYKKKYGLNSHDELCMVIDRDKQSWSEAELSTIAQQCAQKQFLLALSNPAFEIWLLLHLKDINDYSPEEKTTLLENKSQSLKNELKTLLPCFNPNKLKIDQFWDFIPTAIERAQTLDVVPQDRWPNTLGTRIYLVMKKIIATVDLIIE